jgi:hypothetical protein
MPRSKAAAMSRSFLIVLPKEIRSGVAPAASAVRTTSAMNSGRERVASSQENSTSATLLRA